MSNFPETEFSGRDFRFNPVNVRNESIFVYITDQIIKGYWLTFHCDGLWKWFKINHKDIVILTDAHIYINKFVTFIWYLYCLKNMFFKEHIVPGYYCTWAHTFESSLILKHRWSIWRFESLTLMGNYFVTLLFPKPSKWVKKQWHVWIIHLTMLLKESILAIFNNAVERKYSRNYNYS